MGDHDGADESPDEISGDAELVRRLRDAGFTGPLQDAVDIMLVQYALPVLRKWQHDGSIVWRCRKEGRGFPSDLYKRATLHDDVAERIALADEAVARALHTFKRFGLACNGWDPAGGRSLRSYFVTTCVREYAAVFRRWSTERKHQAATAEYGLVPPENLHAPAPKSCLADPAESIVNRLVPDPQLLTVPPDIVRIAQGLADGFTYGEIGTTMGLSARAVEGRIRRFRLKHRRPT